MARLIRCIWLLLLVMAPAVPAAAAPATGFWWNPAEAGRGFAIEVQNGTLFFGTYLYDTNGRATWAISSGAMSSATQYAGTLIPYTGGQTLTGGPRTATAGTSLGNIVLTFTSDTAASLTWPGGTIPLRRYDIVTNGASAAIPAGTPQAGWWWNPAEGGRGFAIEIQNNTLFMTGYMYDGQGNAVWYLAGGAMTSPTLYQGTWAQYGNGQSLTGSYRQATLVNGAVGTISLTFTSATAANLTLPDGRVIPLSRYQFGPATSGFALTSSLGPSGTAMASDYTCDGTGSNPPLSWTGAPAGTAGYALLMTTLPGDGTTKYNWVVHSIPAATTGIAKDAYGIGITGVGSDGPAALYQPPCSSGPGVKNYIFTLYALSGSPALPADPATVTGEQLAQAIAPLTLGTASLTLTATRTGTGSATACTLIRDSLAPSTTGRAQVSCDGTYGTISSTGIANHTMMNGITGTNLQVPVAQNFLGAKGWRIPLAPALAATTTTAADGPIGMAINGVPIFNPCKQGGCQNGDTKVLGELDVCNGHAGRADDYHYHAAPTCVMAARPASYWDTHPVGWALDGFAIYGYNDPSGSVAARDNICGGNTGPVQNGPQGYSYHVTDASPYVLSCFRGTPSPDLAGQGGKYSPMRQPPVTPFTVSGMTLTTDAADGFQVVQFTAPQSFTTTSNGTDSYVNPAGSYRIRYKSLTGTALTTQLAISRNAGKTACWTFQFQTTTGSTTQPETVYCR